MCSVQRIEVPLVEFEFHTDECPCLEAPRDMVEYWQPGQRSKLSVVRPVAEVQRLSPVLWGTMARSYESWRTPAPLMLSYTPEWPHSLPSFKTLPTALA